MTHRNLPVTTLLFLSLFFLSCGVAPENGQIQEKENIKRVVSLYTTILSEGYSHLNMTPLLQVATERQAGKVFHYMSSLAEADTRMISKIEEISFAEPGVNSPQKASVDTAEKWRYSYYSINSDKKIAGNTGRYTVTYSLVKIHDRWMVDDITIHEASEENTPEEVLPFLQRPLTDPFPGKE